MTAQSAAPHSPAKAIARSIGHLLSAPAVCAMSRLNAASNPGARGCGPLMAAASVSISDISKAEWKLEPAETEIGLVKGRLKASCTHRTFSQKY